MAALTSLWQSGAMSTSSLAPAAPASSGDFGPLLKSWRQRRRLSQLALGLDADVSARHISFLESGRSRPSRVMVERLADGLDMPLVERNALLSSAGFAPRYTHAPLDDESLAPALDAMRQMMHAHTPYPALIFDADWTALDANPAGRALLGGAIEGGQANLVELMLDDPAMRARILNWNEIGHAMVTRLRSESRHAGGDARLDALADRVEAELPPGEIPDVSASPFLAVQFDLDGAVLSMFSTVAQISSPYDITLTDVRLELFFPADAQSKAILEAMGDG